MDYNLIITPSAQHAIDNIANTVLNAWGVNPSPASGERRLEQDEEEVGCTSVHDLGV